MGGMSRINATILLAIALLLCNVFAQTCTQLGGSGALQQDSKGNVYTLGCQRDLAWVGDIDSVTASSFKSCFDICGNNSKCRMFTYNLGKCWLKEISSDPNKRPVKSDVDMAWRQGSFERSCSQLGGAGKIYTDDTGINYELGCGKDLAFIGDLTQVVAPSYESCFNICTQNGKCKAFAYWGGKCWLKQLPTNGAQPTNSPDSNLAWVQGSFSSGSGSGSDSGSATAPPASSGSGRSCKDMGGSGAAYTDTDGRKYTLACGKDHLFVGDITSEAAANFESCFDICRKNGKCKAFTFNSGRCYLKDPGSTTVPVVKSPDTSMGWIQGTFPQTTCSNLKQSVSYTDQNGSAYDITCGTNAGGSNIAYIKVTGGYEDCYYQCGLNKACNGFVFVQKDSACGLRTFTDSNSISTKSDSGADIGIMTSVYAAGLQKSQTGSWGSTIKLAVIPIAAAYVPTSGKILVWASSKKMDSTYPDVPEKYTYFADYDLKTGAVSERQISNTQHDMFCPGISTDVNGRIIINGGSNTYAVSIYDPASNKFSRAADMNVPRGYHSSTILSNGNVFLIGGSWGGGIGGKVGEVYSPSSNKWTKLSNCDPNQILTNDKEGVYRSDNHAWLFGWKNGAVFHAGPSKKINWFGTSGSGSTTNVGTRANGQDAMNGFAVMYDVGKILTGGGANSYGESQAISEAHHITLGDSGAAPQVETLAGLFYPRVHVNGVVLPNGEVVVNGGQTYSQIFTDNNPIMYPEIFSPSSKKFTRLMAKESTPRTYHSIALLLPDGTIFSGGGGGCGGCSVNHADAAIYTPPYLYRGDNLAKRPTINSISTTALKASSTFTISVTLSYAKAATFALMRISTVTHSINTDQRRIPLVPKSQSGSQ